MRRGRFLAAAVWVWVLIFWGGPGWGADEIRVGVVGPMAFTQGEGHWNGATMAAEEINSKGGVQVGNKKLAVKLVKVDSNEFLNVTDATNAMERAITFEKVDFLMGGFRTEAVLAMQDIAMEYKKIFLGCGAAHPELCARVAKDYEKYKYWFRVTPINSTFLVKVDFLLLEMVAKKMAAELGIQKPKVAIVAEKAVWADPIVNIAQENLPKMGMEIAGVWRPSPVATDVSAELSAVQSAGAHIIFTSFSSSVGIPFAKQWGELQVPAAAVGINVEAQKDGFWAATGGKGNYTLTMNTYARVKMTDSTISFFDNYKERFKEAPNYTAGTYDAMHILAQAIERAGALDSAKVVKELEKTEYMGGAGKIVFSKDHDVTWGPGFVTALGTQWQDGKNLCVWPDGWQGIKYEGSVDYKIPPWVVAHYKK